jgi:hypothetical protein
MPDLSAGTQGSTLGDSTSAWLQPEALKTQENFVTTTTIGQALPGGEVALFALELVVLKSEKCEFGAVFVPIGRFFEDQHILGLDSRRRAHDSLDLRFRHAGGDLFVIGQGQLRTSQYVSIAARRQGEQRAAKQRK